MKLILIIFILSVGVFLQCVSGKEEAPPKLYKLPVPIWLNGVNVLLQGVGKLIPYALRLVKIPNQNQTVWPYEIFIENISISQFTTPDVVLRPDHEKNALYLDVKRGFFNATAHWKVKGPIVHPSGTIGVWSEGNGVDMETLVGVDSKKHQNQLSISHCTSKTNFHIQTDTSLVDVVYNALEKLIENIVNTVICDTIAQEGNKALEMKKLGIGSSHILNYGLHSLSLSKILGQDVMFLYVGGNVDSQTTTPTSKTQTDGNSKGGIHSLISGMKIW